MAKFVLALMLLWGSFAFSQAGNSTVAGASSVAGQPSHSPSMPAASDLLSTQDNLHGRLTVGSLTETDKLIATLQLQVKQQAKDASRYDRLGAAYFQKARETGDLAYYELAEKTLSKALELSPENFAAADPLVHIALVYMGEHAFTQALSSAEKAIALGAGNLTAFAIEGDAYTDMGEYEKAAAAYQALQKLGHANSSSLEISYMADSRVAYLKFLHGDTADSIRLMQQAVVAALQLNVPPENLAWLYFELGERCFQAGDLKSAELAYESALTTDQHHYRSLAGLAKVRAAQGKRDEAIALYQASIAIVPFPQYIADLGDLYLLTGHQAEAQQQYDLVEYIGYLSKLNRVLNNRELAIFYADRGIKLPQALQLAKAEFEVRHDVYTWDTMAWVLFKNGQLPEAADAIGKALRLHTDDSLILFHAGMIHHALGDDAAAQAELGRALQINPRFHVFYADLATRTLDQIARTKELRSSR